MQLSDNEISILLLTADLALNKDEANCLTPSEWSTFYRKLTEKALEVSFILKEDAKEQLREMGYDEAFAERVQCLVKSKRSILMAMNLEELLHDGISVVTCLSKDYPKLLKKRLKEKMPPFFYYAGELSHAGMVGIGVAGSRNVSPAGMEFAEKLSVQAAAEKLVVYSGGARGVDSIAEYAAMNHNGLAVEYIADSMYKKLKNSEVIRAVMDRRLLLLSDMNPRTGFLSWRAMNRNKYIYASSYATFVVESDHKKGGTWAGATEAMKKGYTEVFVRDDPQIKGNQELIKLGAVPYKEVQEGLKELVLQYSTKKRPAEKEIQEISTEEPEKSVKSRKKKKVADEAAGNEQMTLMDFLNDDNA